MYGFTVKNTSASQPFVTHLYHLYTSARRQKQATFFYAKIYLDLMGFTTNVIKFLKNISCSGTWLLQKVCINLKFSRYHPPHHNWVAEQTNGWQLWMCRDSDTEKKANIWKSRSHQNQRWSVKRSIYWAKTISKNNVLNKMNAVFWDSVRIRGKKNLRANSTVLHWA